MSTPMGGESDRPQPRQPDGSLEQAHTAPMPSGSGYPPRAEVATGDHTDRIDLEREAYGGLQWGSAFFGWITATGMVVFASAVLAGIGALVDQAPNIDLSRVAEAPQSAGWIGAGILLAVILLAYLCGGYVAGRMARFDGGRQGLAVWLWTLLMAAVVTAVGLGVGRQFDVTEQLSGLPTIPIEQGEGTLAAAVAGLVVLAVALIGALIGGRIGMRFHRKVDAMSHPDAI